MSSCYISLSPATGSRGDAASVFVFVFHSATARGCGRRRVREWHDVCNCSAQYLSSNGSGL